MLPDLALSLLYLDVHECFKFTACRSFFTSANNYSNEVRTNLFNARVQQFSCNMILGQIHENILEFVKHYKTDFLPKVQNFLILGSNIPNFDIPMT